MRVKVRKISTAVIAASKEHEVVKEWIAGVEVYWTSGRFREGVNSMSEERGRYSEHAAELVFGIVFSGTQKKKGVRIVAVSSQSISHTELS